MNLTYPNHLICTTFILIEEHDGIVKSCRFLSGRFFLDRTKILISLDLSLYLEVKNEILDLCYRS